MQQRRVRLFVPVVVTLALAGLAGLDRVSRAQPAASLEQPADAIAMAALRAGPIPGLSVAVARHGRTLVAKGYGQANVELETPATASTVYRIGSITQQFTAAAIMRLVEGGKIGLDDPIEKYLTDFPTGGRRITVRHLLNHTSAIKSYTSLGFASHLAYVPSTGLTVAVLTNSTTGKAAEIGGALLKAARSPTN
jgi:CubicO group peptidase (beta-lactamase class C family)